MNQLLKKVLTYITYKEETKIQDFYIPEADSDSINPPCAGNHYKANDSENKCAKVQNDGGNSIGKAGDKSIDKYSISQDIACNINSIRSAFNYPSNKDIKIREFIIGGDRKAFLVYVDGMVNGTNINNFILRPLLNSSKLKDISPNCPLEGILYSIIEVNDVKKVESFKEMSSELLSGNTGVYVEGCNYFLFCETKGYEKRSVDKPQIEGVVKGSQEAFNENLRTNITLLRRILKTRDFTAEMLTLGERGNNSCAVLYINGLTNPAIIEEVKRRLKSISTDSVMGDGYIEQFIEDSPWSIIPTVIATERPDKTAAHLLEGKVAVICEGTPFSLIMPITFFDLLHTPEDMSLKWQYGTMLRFIRVFALFVATMLPGLYISLTTFHREMIPTDLLIAIAKARENVPFPTVFEVILMEASFELIREAGIRIPGIIGNTIGIIGALILGQAAVSANIVSPVLIIIIAFTGLGNFAIPNFSLAFGVRIMRIMYIILAGFLGFFGMSLGAIVSIAMICSTKSFGVPILAPFAPKTRRSKDLIIRRAIFEQEMRPDYTNTLDPVRQPEVSRKWIKQKPYSSMKKKREDDSND